MRTIEHWKKIINHRLIEISVKMMIYGIWHMQVISCLQGLTPV